MGRLLFFDGFDHYDSAHILSKWSTANGPVTIAPSQGRTGAALQGGPGVRLNLPTDHNELILGYAVYWSLLPGAGHVAAGPLGLAFTGNPPLVTLGVDAVGALHAGTVNGDAQQGGDLKTDYGKSINALVGTGLYYYNEFHVNLSAGTFVARHNGVEVINLTGVAYGPSGTLVNQLVINAAGYYTNANWKIDDLYLLDPSDTTGNAPNTFLGDIRVEYVAANAPGRANQFAVNPSTSTAWQVTSDNPPDDDATFLSSATLGDVSTVHIAPPAGTTNIIAIQTLALARKDSAGTRVINTGVGNGVTESYTGPDISLPDTYQYVRQIFDTNPITGAAYVAADLATLEVALKVKA